MKLLIISDLHFKENNDWQRIDETCNKMYDVIENNINLDDEFICVVLGDIIDCGSKRDENIEDKYKEASVFLEKFKSKFSNVKFLFVPGNHDLEEGENKLEAFNIFSQKYSYGNRVFDSENVVKIRNNGLALFLVNTNLNGNYSSNGKMDINELIEKNSGEKNLIFMHHPPINDSEDNKVIENSKNLIETRPNFIFYGHQHGYASIPEILVKDTDVYSVGGLFFEDLKGNKEFLFMDICSGRINYAMRYNWSGVKFVMRFMFPKKKDLKSHNLYFHSPDVNINESIRYFMDETTDYEQWNLITLIKKYNKIFILGDAGQGKTYELSFLYRYLEKSDQYFPIWVSLRAVTFKQLKEYFEYVKWNTIDNKIPFLILDGLDEMKNEEIGSFIQHVESTLIGNSAVKVIVSARSNYNLEINGFRKFKILPLDKEVAERILIDKNVDDTEDFFQCLRESGCEELFRSPFYLNEIITIFKSKGTIPKRNELFDEMITLRLRNNQANLSCSLGGPMLSNEYQINQYLEELAFFMHAQKDHYIDNFSYTRNFEKAKREIIEKTGIITVREIDDKLKWAFEHNILKEYLVARYISELPMKELLSIITSDESHVRLKLSWKNVLGHLIILRANDDLSQWILNNKELHKYMFQIEKDILSKYKISETFELILNNLDEKKLPIYSVYDDMFINNLLKHCNRAENIEFLYNNLMNPLSDNSIINALYLLGKYIDFCGMESELRKLIKPYLSHPNYLHMSFAIKAYYKVGGHKRREAVRGIIAVLGNVDEERIVLEIIRVIKKSREMDAYFDYIFAVFENIQKYNTYIQVRLELFDVIKEIKDYKNIIKILNSAIENIGIYTESYTELCKILIINVHEYNLKDEYNELIEIYMKAAKFYRTEIRKELDLLFKSKGAGLKLYEAIRDSDENLYKIDCLVDVITSNCILDNFIEDFRRGLVSEKIFRSCACDIIEKAEDKNEVKKINDILETKKLPPMVLVEKRNNMIERKDLYEQKYFDCLFSNFDFKVLVEELIDHIGNIKCKDVSFDLIQDIEYNRVDLRRLINILTYLNLDCDISDFVDTEAWEGKKIQEIKYCLKNFKNLKIEENQKKKIKDYCDRIFKNIGFEIINKGGTQYSSEIQEACLLVFFIMYFDFEYSDHELLKLTLIPEIMVYHIIGNSERKISDYIIEKIQDINKVNSTIEDNLINKVLSDDTLEEHIVYCLKNKLDYAEGVCEKIILEDRENIYSLKSRAIDYLIQQCGEGYVDILIGRIENPTDDLLHRLFGGLKKEKENCLFKLIEANQKDESQLKFLAYLIKSNSEYGVEKYVELVEKKKTLPDIQGEMSETTDAMREVNDIGLLKYIKKLYVICYNERFIDIEFFGLRSSLFEVVRNMMKSNSYEIKVMLQELLDENQENEAIVRAVNYSLIEIEKYLDISCDEPISLSCVKKIIKKQQQKSSEQQL